VALYNSQDFAPVEQALLDEMVSNWRCAYFRQFTVDKIRAGLFRVAVTPRITFKTNSQCDYAHGP
jgi:hypothetical protein